MALREIPRGSYGEREGEIEKKKKEIRRSRSYTLQRTIGDKRGQGGREEGNQLTTALDDNRESLASRRKSVHCCR